MGIFAARMKGNKKTAHVSSTGSLIFFEKRRLRINLFSNSFIKMIIKLVQS
jgi:hypothetical protein